MATIPATLEACQQLLQLVRKEARLLKQHEILLMDAIAKKRPKPSMQMDKHRLDPEGDA